VGLQVSPLLNALPAQDWGWYQGTIYSATGVGYNKVRKELK